MQSSILSPARWTRRSAENPRRTLIAWGIALVAALGIIATMLSGALTTDQKFVGTPEFDRATELIENEIGLTDSSVETVLVNVKDGRVDAPAVQAEVGRLAERVSELGPEVVSSVATPWSGGGSALISKDGRAALVPITMAGDLNAARDNIEAVLAEVEKSSGVAGIETSVAGQAAIDKDVNEVAEKDLLRGEAIGIPIALLILVLVFGALMAALLPVGLAVVSIIVALALTALIGQVFELSFFVTNMITMIGLAVGIDYVLFVVSRFREERAAGVEKIEAIVRAGDTAGRAVLFSGITVVVALLGMLIVPMSVFVSLGVGAITVVVAAVAAAMTLLPAMLSVLGDRIETGNLSRFLKRLFPSRREGGEGFWPKAVHGVMKRPAASFAAAAALLLLAAVPYFDIETGASGVTTLPSNLQSRQAYEQLQRDFSVGQVAPARIPILGDPASPKNQAEIDRITNAVAGDPILGTPFLEARRTDKGAILSVPVNADPATQESADAVRRLRDATERPVGGTPSLNVDYFDISSRYLPIVIGIVLALSFVVLLVAFRSIVVPLLAIVLNLLSVGAAFGLLTLVSQQGHGAGFFGFQQTPTVEAWVPLFLFSVLFGLSMDYHVFLLSRIRERFDLTGDNAGSITHGISTSARLITGAALIMVAVFGGFAAGDLVMFQQMGFGLGVAVLIDATIVRTVLVPAAMKLLGKWNWYLPKALDWLPHLEIEGPARTGVVAK